jgi:hypothetical protein
MSSTSVVRLAIVACAAVAALTQLSMPTSSTARRSGPAPRIATATSPQAPVQAVQRVAAVSQTGSRPVFGFRMTPEGGRQIYFGGPDLQFAKTRFADGRTVVELTSADDRVAITASAESGIAVERNGQRVAFYHRDATEEHLDRTRAVLAGSKAVRRFRLLASTLDDSKHPGIIGVQIVDALVGVLDGDFGAVARLSTRMRSQNSANVRRISDEDEGACWDAYSAEVVNAANDYISCAEALGYNPLSAFCAVEWTIRVEGAWSQYLFCVGFPRILRD